MVILVPEDEACIGGSGDERTGITGRRPLLRCCEAGLPFPLLVDSGHAVADLYDVWRERSNGKMGILRSAFVVGPDGRLVRASYDVKPEDTTPQALAALSA